MRKTYVGKDVDVSFDPRSASTRPTAFRGLPAVFDSKHRPWIVPDNASADEVVAQVKRCPSGALQYHLRGQ